MTEDISSTPKAEAMIATPGYSEFKQNYSQFLSLAEVDQEDFLMHDVSNMTTTLFNTIVDGEMMGSLEVADKYGRLLKDYKAAGKRSSERLRIVSDAIGGLDQINEKQVLEFYADQGKMRLKQMRALKKIFPVLQSSVGFLDQPTSANLERLLSQKTDLQTILDVTMVDLPLNVNYPVDAPNAIILINLLNNAKKFGGEGIKIDMKKDEITISNPSRNPLPERLFELGGKGGNGNRGYGLFLAQKLYAPMIDHTVTATSDSLPSGKYNVSFALRSNGPK